MVGSMYGYLNCGAELNGEARWDGRTDGWTYGVMHCEMEAHTEGRTDAAEVWRKPELAVTRQTEHGLGSGG